MEKVIERPALSTDVRALVAQLQVVLQQYGYRINKLEPLDGSEPMTVPPAYADDAAAAVGGLAVGMRYRTGSVLKVRVA